MKTVVAVAIILSAVALATAQSPIGGYIYLIKNGSGATMYRGYVLESDSASSSSGPPYAVTLTNGGDLYPIGTVYSDSIVNKGIGFMTTSGAGYVDCQKNRTATLVPGDRVLTVSADTVGKANCETTTSVTNHFREIGQPITKMIGVNAKGDSICIADIHKN